MNSLNFDLIRNAVTQGIVYVKNNEKKVKIAATVIALIVAVLFFAGYGKNKDITITQSEENSVFAEATDTAITAMPIYIDISGEVKNPGVYKVADGTRLFEVIEKAGGLTDNAGLTYINQAEIVTDGQKIIIPDSNSELEVSGGSSGITNNGQININLADSAELQEIPGVGPATAEKIIDYRNSNGKFNKIEDLMNVNGIGNKTFEKIKDLITV